jgi:hypothetical protein
MTSVPQHAVNVPPGEGSDWFGPSQPLKPIAPSSVAGRQFDYQTGFNLNLTPRPYEPVDFRTLRALADAYDPCRLIIERRKDQACKVTWTIRAKQEDGAKRPSSSQLSPAMQSTIRDVEQFFRFPCEGMSFRTWLRMLLEDLLVLDAPSIYCERTAGGNLVGLAPVDGGLIRPIIDDSGRTPRPMRWDGQPFNWCGKEINRTNYLDIGCRIVDGLLYVPAYAQTLKGLPAHNYTTWDMIYRPLNLRTNSVFGRSPVEQIALTISTGMRRGFSQLEYMREGNQPDAIFAVPETWGPDQIQRLQDWWDESLSGNLAARRKMKFLPSGRTNAYTPLKEPPLKSEIDEWLTRICCFAFSYPPSAFVSLSNRSIAESHERQAEEEGLEPLKAWAKEAFDEIIAKEFGDEVEFAWSDEQEVDPVKQKEILTGYAESGIMTLNEAREALGLSPDPNPAASQLAAMTATGYVAVGTTNESELKGRTNDDTART